MPFEYTPPKYAQITAALQERIESGEYPPGSLLPSEHQLAGEFGTARPTVVRALRELRQAGWIETQQGKGSFVRGRAALAGVAAPRRGLAELDRDESREPGELISAGRAKAPPRIALLLDVKKNVELVCRKRVVRQADGGDPSEIVTWWLPVGLAERSGLDKAEPVHGGVRPLLARVADIRIDHVVEQVTARPATAQEAELLEVSKSAPLLVLYVSARDASGSPALVLEIAMSGDLHELEDAYPVG